MINKEFDHAIPMRQRGTYTNVSRGLIDTLLVDNLVTGKETQGVGEVLEGLDDTEDLLVVDRVVGAGRVGAVKRATGQRGVHIENHVDTRSVEDGGTLAVVDIGRQVVHTDGVDLDRSPQLAGVNAREIQQDGKSYTQVLHESSIAQAGICITQGVLGGTEARGTTGLVAVARSEHGVSTWIFLER